MKSKFYLFVYECKHAFVGMKRNFMLCFSAISAMSICVLFMTAFLITGLHVSRFSKSVESGVRIHAVLESNASTTIRENVKKEIEALENVQKVEFSSKDEELEIMIQEKGEAFAAYRGKNNPLSDAFFIYVVNGDEIGNTAKQIKQISGVKQTTYGGSSVTKLVSLMKVVRRVGYVIAIFLMVLSLYLISNAIRTMIFSRQEEISIMRTVGATDSFIRRPFEIQGILIGLIGAIPTFLILYFGYPRLYTQLDGILIANQFSLIPPHDILLFVGVLTLVLGILVGYLASIVSVTKYIKEQR
ncbi:MAG: permease-like cell division protein FtsX [Bacillota bacterium]|nr:permease-like cell division protein FtsX [Bacillota bacterium]